MVQHFLITFECLLSFLLCMFGNHPSANICVLISSSLCVMITQGTFKRGLTINYYSPHPGDVCVDVQLKQKKKEIKTKRERSGQLELARVPQRNGGVGDQF